MVKIRDIDHGYAKMRERIREYAKRREVHVGVIGSKASASHGEITNAELATIHEFGRGRVPERSFIRATVDAEKPQIHTLLRRVATGKVGIDRGLSIVGEFVRGKIQRRIESNIAPPLHPKTIERKGSSVALIDSGQLVNSITYAVVPAAKAAR